MRSGSNGLKSEIKLKKIKNLMVNWELNYVYLTPRTIMKITRKSRVYIEFF